MTKSTFNLFISASLLLVPLWAGGLAVSVARADEEFKATVDRTTLTEDDAVSLKLTVKIEGNTQIGDPQFSAPDFDLVNQFDNTYLESLYENGKFTVRNTRDATRVLRPMGKGKFKIDGISVQVGGRRLNAPPIEIEVVAGGAGTPAPQAYGGAGVGLRGAGKQLRGKGLPVFVRAEVDKQKVAKGEQIIVSYYLYRRVRVYNIQVDKYPALPGFLREDLEMPVLGQRLTSETVALDGVAFDRSLLVRYAVYPLKDGKLTIDPMALKASYYAGNPNEGRPGAPGFEDEDEIFQPFMNFFQNMAPKVAQSSSEPLTIEVEPLPESGRPASFTGGVGEFDVSAQADKTEVKAGEAVTLTVKVVGRGNLASIAEPKVAWPLGVELYESKGRSKSGKGGLGEKVFEILLIPRRAGKVTLPPIEFGFYEPKKGYTTRSTQPIDLLVKEGEPGSEVPLARPEPVGRDSAVEPLATILPLKPEAELSKVPVQGLPQGGGPKGLKTVVLVASGVLLFWILAFIFIALRKFSGRESKPKVVVLDLGSEFRELLKTTQSVQSGGSLTQVLECVGEIENLIYQSIDALYGLGAKGYSRAELEQKLLIEKGFSESLWKKIARVLVWCEVARFGSKAGVLSENEMRRELHAKALEAEKISREIGRSAPGESASQDSENSSKITDENVSEPS